MSVATNEAVRAEAKRIEPVSEWLYTLPKDKLVALSTTLILDRTPRKTIAAYFGWSDRTITRILETMKKVKNG